MDERGTAPVPTLAPPCVSAAGQGGGKEVLFGTKAETLERFGPRVRRCEVPPGYHFTAERWRSGPDEIVEEVLARFGGVPLAVRSSTRAEDGALASAAGAFRSVLDVESNAEAIRRAVKDVLASYGADPRDQVLVQPMVQGVTLSGVIMTYDLDSGAPYYVVNYDDETGTTDRVTGGVGVNKTVIVYRGFARHYVESPRVAELLEMAQDLERVCGGAVPLDIEFAKARGTLHLLQVRRMAVQKHWDHRVAERVSVALHALEEFLAQHSRPQPGVAGTRTILGQMPDWNPAEIIGARPRPLALSLYRYLVTDTAWRQARRQMGYRDMANQALMISLAGRPYVDVRNSFNSFLPAGLDHRVEDRLVNAWLDRLAAHPVFHDKIEFEVALTTETFTFTHDMQARYPGILMPEELARYQARLHALTLRNLTLAPGGSLRRAQAAFRRLEQTQAVRPVVVGRGEVPVWEIRRLLEECRQMGTLPFAVVARHAFMAESLLRSAVQRGALSGERLAAFKRSVKTVAGELAQDFAEVMEGEAERTGFLARYGHLRPGTYDILSPRYDQRPDLFAGWHPPARTEWPAAFVLTTQERLDLQRLLTEARFDEIDPEQLLRYAEAAIAGREGAKFVFSRHLSDALELLAVWGEQLGLSRDDLSYLAIGDLLDRLADPPVTPLTEYFLASIRRRRAEAEAGRPLRLGYIIRDARDLYVVPLHRSAPNFVTGAEVTAPVQFLDGRSTSHSDLVRHVICVENADPGFDWIFTRDIAGLVTKYGGANSHMTIRCAELQIPAAIGVGEQTFDRIVAAGCAELNCAQHIVRPAERCTSPEATWRLEA